MIEKTINGVAWNDESFTLTAIKKLRKGTIKVEKDGKESEKTYYGIHTVYSGFNKAFTDVFGVAPRATLERMAKEGKVVLRPAKGGFSIYLPEDKPKLAETTESIIGKILG